MQHPDLVIDLARQRGIELPPAAAHRRRERRAARPSACAPGSDAASCAGVTGWRPPRPSPVRRRPSPTGHDGTMTSRRSARSPTPPTTRPRAERRQLTDAKEMRALAHPTRVAAIELLSREGPMTATQLGEILDESPANISFHLRTLAKYGFVEEAPGGTGRERPWTRVGHRQLVGARQRRRRHGDRRRRPRPPHGPAGLRAPRRVGADPRVVLQGVARGRRSSATRTTYLTADELREVGEEMSRIARSLRRPHGRPHPATGRRDAGHGRLPWATRCRRPRRATDGGRRLDRRPGPRRRSPPATPSTSASGTASTQVLATVPAPRPPVRRARRSRPRHRLGVHRRAPRHRPAAPPPPRHLGPARRPRRPRRGARGRAPGARRPRRPGCPSASSTAQPELAHVDVHPGGRGHTHLDLRYLFTADDADPAPPPEESQEVGWFPWDGRPTRRRGRRMAGILARPRDPLRLSGAAVIGSLSASC